jgi:hypothetical protein
VSGGRSPTPSFSRSRGEHAFKDQLTTERDRPGIVDRQYPNRRSTRGSEPPKSRAMPPEDEPSLSSHASALEGLASFGLHDRQDIRCLDVFVEILLL